jgi:hypothetical protein
MTNAVMTSVMPIKINIAIQALPVWEAVNWIFVS